MSPKTIKVNDDQRYLRRKIKSALGKDILRYIVELVTNSDDSYRRIEKSNPEKVNVPKKIYIRLSSGKRSNDNYIIDVI